MSKLFKMGVGLQVAVAFLAVGALMTGHGPARLQSAWDSGAFGLTELPGCP